jgi:nucleoside-diphosphate-sugar epimerase
VARLLIVGCGCRGRSLAAALPEHTVRGTSRSSERIAELETTGIEGVVADPDRLATLVPALSGVTVVCWLMGDAVTSPEVNGARLATFAEHLVDTPVRGLIYEAAGSVDAFVLGAGAQIVRTASQTWHIPVQVVTTDPADHEAWLEAMKRAVERTLSTFTA